MSSGALARKLLGKPGPHFKKIIASQSAERARHIAAKAAERMTQVAKVKRPKMKLPGMKSDVKGAKTKAVPSNIKKLAEAKNVEIKDGTGLRNFKNKAVKLAKAGVKGTALPKKVGKVPPARTGLGKTTNTAMKGKFSRPKGKKKKA